MPHPVVQLDLPVVRLDLGREHVEPDAEAFDELARQLRPVHVGRGGQMRRPRAGRAGELREVIARLDLGGDAVEAPREHGELLAHRRRGRRLAVRAGEHGGVAVLTGEVAEGRDHGAQLREPHLLDGALHGERVGRRVDVLARACEVGELGDGGEPERLEPVAHEVLDGLHVVTRDGFLLGQPVDLRLAEVAVQSAQALLLGILERRRAEQAAVREGDDPLDLDLDAGAVEARLGEVVGEARHRGAVASVERAQGLRGQCGHDEGSDRGHRALRTQPEDGRTAGSSCRKSARLALSIISSTSSNIFGPA